MDVGFDGVDGLINDELDADRGGEMEDDIALFNQQVHRAGISHGVADELKVRVVLNGCDVVDGAGAEVIDDGDLVPGGQIPFRQVRSDKARPACDQYVHR